MIAACPRCAARYRIEKERLRADGVKLRCSRCQAVFRVRPPTEEPDAAPAAAPEPRVRPAPAPAPPPAREPAPAEREAPPRARAAAPERAPERGPERAHPAAAPASGDLVLLAIPDADLAKRTEEALRGWGLRTACVADGVEAILEIQRQLPRVALLSAALPRMYGFQICELMKRNESLRSIGVVLVGSVHHPDRYRRPPHELYGADAYVEEPDLPEALRPALERLGLAVRRPAAPVARAPRPAREAAPPAGDATAPPVPPRAARSPAPAAPPAAPADDGLADQRAKAERLARIIVSDIVLYNEAKFAAAVRAGNVLEAMAGDLDEGRSLFRERIDERVRAERDHLADELLRVARARS